MGNLVLLLLGVDYLRKRARGLLIVGSIFLVTGITLFLDALDGAIYFPLNFFAALLVIEGLATLMIAKSGVGGQRVLRYAKGAFVLAAGVLVLVGHHHGHFVLSMIFGLMFLVDGLIQCTAAYVVRYERWRYVFASGVAEYCWPFSFPALPHPLRRHGALLPGPVPVLLRPAPAVAGVPRAQPGFQPRAGPSTPIRTSCPRARMARRKPCSTARRWNPSAR